MSAPDRTDMAATAYVIQPIGKRCIIAGCRVRSTVMVAVADPAGIVGPDSVLIATCCADKEHQRMARTELSLIVVKARLAHEYGPGATSIIGDPIVIQPNDAGPS